MKTSEAKSIVRYRAAEYVLDLAEDDDFLGEYDEDDQPALLDAIQQVGEELEVLAER